ncbi:MAG TPA: hypothetical protein DCW29_01655 [Janthinobacterium sp.]|nr:hypothetical protein [Janthinobacterium sp.]
MNSTTIQSASRIHPLVAGAAISITVLSLVGVAAIAGWLPTSHGAIAPQDTTLSANAPLASSAPVLSQNAPQQYSAHTPAVHHTQHVHRATQTAQASYDDRNDRYDRQPAERPYVQQAAAPAPAQTNYVGIGTGAVLGGLLGNQVGGGRGKTLATIAGVVGGGMLGNAVQNQVQQPQR